jgi:hypothetical protein
VDYRRGCEECCQYLLGKAKGKGPLERSGCRCESNIRMNLKYELCLGFNRTRAGSSVVGSSERCGEHSHSIQGYFGDHLSAL